MIESFEWHNFAISIVNLTSVPIVERFKTVAIWKQNFIEIHFTHNFKTRQRWRETQLFLKICLNIHFDLFSNFWYLEFTLKSHRIYTLKILPLQCGFKSRHHFICHVRNELPLLHYYKQRMPNNVCYKLKTWNQVKSAHKNIVIFTNFIHFVHSV